MNRQKIVVTEKMRRQIAGAVAEIDLASILVTLGQEKLDWDWLMRGVK